LVEAIPETGHQLRKHFKHTSHFGSRPHGCNKQNKLWLEHFELTGMMLHASVNFNHPITNEPLILNAKINEEFSRVGYS
jgi:tRNA pseudouridine65 synthase